MVGDGRGPLPGSETDKPMIRKRSKRLAFKAMALASRARIRLDSSSRLRILAYHDVPDAARLALQLQYLSEHFTPVDLSQALEVLSGSRSVDRPVWLTFDDGDPSVVENGTEVLSELGMRATLFVCPGHVDTEEPYWWHITERALDLGIEIDTGTVSDEALARLKGVPDEQRRREVHRLAALIAERKGSPHRLGQLTTEQIRRWLDEGNSLGNHTWDHPILSRCTPKQQRRQIEAAHHWLRDNSFMERKVFAYPNGNITAFAESVLSEFGYEAALLFDHRIAGSSHPLRTSRIRVNANDDMDTWVARVSGVHPFIHHALGRP